MVERSESIERDESHEKIAAIIAPWTRSSKGKNDNLMGACVWCDSIPHKRKVAAVRGFYSAFHEAKILPIQTCTVCYRKFGNAELEEFESTQSMLADLHARYGCQFGFVGASRPAKACLCVPIVLEI